MRPSALYLAGLALVLILPCSSAQAAACKVYPFLASLAADASPCRQAAIAADRDGDGITDWVLHPSYGAFVMPLDRDLDNDGLDNLVDPEPQRFNATNDQDRSFPDHLLDPSAVIQRAQRRLFQRYRIYAQGHRMGGSLAVLQAFTRVLASRGYQAFAGSQPPFQHLVFAERLHNGRAMAVYIEPLGALVVARDLVEQKPRDIESTLAHELGHAFVFQRMRPREVTWIANRYGGWALGPVSSLYDAKLFAPAAKQPMQHSTFPTRYSYQNVHEWIAENFASLVTGRDRPASPLQAALWARLKAIGRNPHSPAH